MRDEDDEEITTIHTGELAQPGPEGTVRLGAPRHAVPHPHEETVLLSADAPGAEARSLRPSDSGWGTVVLPGGGHPAHVVDSTQLLAIDDPAASASITATTRLSAGAPDSIDSVDTATLTGIGRPPRAEPASASASPFRGLGPAAWTIPRIGLASTPTGPAGRQPAAPVASAVEPHGAVPAASAAEGRYSAVPTDRHAMIPVAGHQHAPPAAGGHPVVPISGAHPLVISGGHSVVPLTPTGGHPLVPRATPRGRGRGPARTSAPTGAHAGLRSAASDDSRLAWGFLLGVLITVAIVSVAVALSLYFLG